MSRAIVPILLSIVVIFGIRNLAVATPIPTGYAVLSNLTIEDPATIIHGDMRSNSQIRFSGNYFVYGSVFAHSGFTGLDPSRITGTIDGAAPIIALPTLADAFAAFAGYITLSGNIAVDSSWLSSHAPG